MSKIVQSSKWQFIKMCCKDFWKTLGSVSVCTIFFSCSNMKGFFMFHSIFHFWFFVIVGKWRNMVWIRESFLPYDITKNAKLTDNFDHFSFTFSRPNNIVGCYWRIYPIHQNVSVSFICICYIWQKGWNILAINVVSTTFS